jgi:Protein  of unknown function (DUF3018)
MKSKSKRRPAQMRATHSVRKAKRQVRPAVKRAEAKSSREKVCVYRQRMRAKGLRLIQIWLPNTRTAEFAAEAHRQSVLPNRSPYAAEDQAWVDRLSDWNPD